MPTEIPKDLEKMLMGHIGMKADFDKIETLLGQDKFKPVLDYVIEDMSKRLDESGKPMYGNSLADIKESPESLIRTEMGIHQKRYAGTLAEFKTKQSQFDQFSKSGPTPEPWSKMCTLLREIIANAEKECAKMEQTALRYIGGIMALEKVAEGFKTKYQMPLETSGDDGASAKIRLDALGDAVSTVTANAKELREKIGKMRDDMYKKAPDGVKMPKPGVKAAAEYLSHSTQPAA